MISSVTTSKTTMSAIPESTRVKSKARMETANILQGLQRDPQINNDFVSILHHLSPEIKAAHAHGRVVTFDKLLTEELMKDT